MIELLIASPFLSSMVFLIGLDVRNHFTKDVSHIARLNANGNYTTRRSLYARSEVEASKHISEQKEMAEHADGNPFYCNTFTGAKKRFYDLFYNKELKKNKRSLEKASRKREAKKKAQKQKDKALSLEMQRVDALDLKAQLYGNMKDRKQKVG